MGYRVPDWEFRRRRRERQRAKFVCTACGREYDWRTSCTGSGFQRHVAQMTIRVR